MNKKEFFESHCFSPFGEHGQNFFKNFYCNFSFPKHFHDEFLIQIISRGRNIFFCNGHEYVGRPGDVVLINPGEIHNGTCVPNEPLEYKVFYIENEKLNSILASKKLGVTVPFLFGQTLVKDAFLFHKINRYFDRLSGNIYDPDELFTNYLEILLRIAGKYISGKFPDADEFVYHKEIMQFVKEYIHNHLDDDLSLNHLSKLFAISPFHFLRLFTKYTGLTPHQYILVRKIEKAKSLLRKRNSVVDVAFSLGFSDHGNFTKSFKKMSGLTPTQFQRCFQLPSRTVLFNGQL